MSMKNSNVCPCNGIITGGQIPDEPDKEDTNYPIGFIGWAPNDTAWLHIGSGRWIYITANPPGD